MADSEDAGVMSLTVTLLSAYFANNTVPSGELPALVEGTRRALLGDAPAAASVAATSETAEAPQPPASPQYKAAVSVEDSLASPDQILSLIDGKPYKALKRHLSTHGLTPAEYRLRYDLPADYPMVAPGYSAARREVALRLGLGNKPKADGAAADLPPAAEPARETPAAETVEPAAAEPAAAKPARRTRANAFPVEPKTTADKPKRKATAKKVPTPSKASARSKAPAAVEAAPPEPKTKRSRAPKKAVETPAPAVAE